MLAQSKAPRTQPTVPSPPQINIRQRWLGNSRQKSKADSGGASNRSTTCKI